ncbi:hypothetical protein HZB90_05020, partial [archaeon]|nr:hypothetical protein [archaeon]
VALAAAAVGGVYLFTNNDTQAEKRVEEMRQYNRDEGTRQEYVEIFRDAYAFVEQSIISGGVKNDLTSRYQYSLLDEEDPIESVARRHDLDPKLIANILLVNSLYAKRKDSDMGTNPVFLFDPIATRKSMQEVEDRGRYDARERRPSGSPAEILEQGAARLAGLIHKNNGDLKRALTEFYSPVYEQNPPGGRDRWWLRGTYSDEIAAIINQEIEMLVHNVLNGPDADYGGYVLDTFANGYLNRRYAALQR